MTVVVVVMRDDAQSILDYRGTKPRRSPNYDTNRNGSSITCIVLHGSSASTVEWFQNSASKTSAHYLIEPNGTVIQMVREKYAAWHMGLVSSKSLFSGQPKPNLWCIGIQFSRNLHNNNIMPEVQIQAGSKLIANIKSRYKNIRIYTHDQFNIGMPCPGPNFPLNLLK